MNIFVLSTAPSTAARMMCDKHVVKMVLETAQILSTVKILLGEEGAPYKPTHVNHPCVQWAKQKENRCWLTCHFDSLLHEYKERYNKEHKCAEIKNDVCFYEARFWPISFVQCMPEQYKVPNDPVAAYRAYYLGEKARFAKWKLGNVPPWWTEGQAKNMEELNV